MRRAQGFTLVETLIALILVGAVLLPASFWLYRSWVGRAAWQRFQAGQALEMRMNRVFLLRPEQDISEEIKTPVALRIEIRLVRNGPEMRRMGTARDKWGKILSRLEAAHFEGGK